MYKKLIVIMLTLVAAVSLCLGLAGCNHKHGYSTEWTKDETYHWHAPTCEDTDEVKDKAEHTWDEGKITTEATTTSTGVKTYTCTVCNQTKTETIPALTEEHTHGYTEKVTSQTYLASEATCTAKATYYYSCTCGEKGTETFEYGEVDLNNHVGETEVRNSKEATCTEEGYTGDTYCKSCGNEILKGTTSPEMNHNYDWVSNGDGTHTGICVNDPAHTETEACSGGTATCITKAVCEVCKGGYGELDKTNHKQEAVWIQGKESHVKQYPCCGEMAGNLEPHAWENGKCTLCGYECEHSGGTATCAEKAICSNCGASYGDLLAHTLTKTEAKAATCTEAGYEAYWTCSDCNKLFSDEGTTKISAPVEIPMHTYDSDGFCTKCSTPQAATDSDNDGYYEIDNAGKLFWFAAQVNGGSEEIDAELTANIVIPSGKTWTPIGSYDGYAYNGTFDGDGKTISGIVCTDTSKDYVGLFGYTEVYATIKNVGVINSDIQGNKYVGAIVGNNGGTITNCYNTGNVTGAGTSVRIIDSVTTATDNTSESIGGIAGYSTYKAKITNCYNTGNVTSNNGDTGGIVGTNYGDVKNCYNTGSISAYGPAGGIAGDHCRSSITNCYNTGTVTVRKKNSSGGIVGECGSSVTDCYYLECDFDASYVFGEAKSAEAFASGEVAYLLNGNKSDGALAFYQTLSTDSVPTLDSGRGIVYAGYIGCDLTYSNNQAELSSAPAHSFTEKTATSDYLMSAATCTQKAIYYYSCSVCGEKGTETFEYGDLLAHTLTKTEAKAATCTEAGYEAYWTCSTCNKLFSDEQGINGISAPVEIPAAHNYEQVAGGKVCSGCGRAITNAGLVLTLNSDSQSYSVSGYETAPTALQIPSSFNGVAVTSVDREAFYQCGTLTSVVIPDSVTYIGENAFRYSTLTSVKIGNGMKTINQSVFEGCTNLTTVIFSDSVTSIGHWAFYQCDNLSVVYYGGTEDRWSEITMGQKIECLTNATRYYYSANKPTAYGSYWHYDSDGNPAVWAWTVSDGLAYRLTDDGTGYEVCGTSDAAASVVIPDTFNDGTNGTLPVTTIIAKAFKGNTAITSVTIGGNVTTIGGNAFSGTGITWLVIPGNVIEVGMNAFAENASLKAVVIDANADGTLQNYVQGTFYKCAALTTVTLPETLKATAKGMFDGCTALTSVNTDYITDFDEKTFKNCSSLTEVVLGAGVTNIGANAFLNCSALKNAYYKGTKDDWSKVTVSSTGNSALTAVLRYYAETVLTTNYSGYWHYVNDVPTVWAESQGLTFVLNDGKTGYNVTGIGTCTDTVIIIPATYNDGTNGSLPVTAIADTAFRYTSITSVVLPESVDYIGASAFQEVKKLSSVALSNKVKYIGQRAFIACKNITSIVLPTSVTIVDYAFDECKSLSAVYYMGTVSDWSESVSIGTGNDSLTGATRYYYSAENPFSGGSDEGNYWHYDESGNIVVWTKES